MCVVKQGEILIINICNLHVFSFSTRTLTHTQTWAPETSQKLSLIKSLSLLLSFFTAVLFRFVHSEKTFPFPHVYKYYVMKYDIWYVEHYQVLMASPGFSVICAIRESILCHLSNVCLKYFLERNRRKKSCTSSAVKRDVSRRRSSEGGLHNNIFFIQHVGYMLKLFAWWKWTFWHWLC